MMSFADRYLTGIIPSTQPSNENNVMKLLEEQKKLSQDLLKQNTSLILLSANLSKEIKDLKAETTILQDCTNEMKIKMDAKPTKTTTKKGKGKLSTALTVRHLA